MGNNPYRICCPKGYGFCVISVQKQLAGIDFAQIGQESGMEVWKGICRLNSK